MSEKQEFSEEEVLAMRRNLAKSWRQRLSQVTDYEARHYLKLQRSSLKEREG